MTHKKDKEKPRKEAKHGGVRPNAPKKKRVKRRLPKELIHISNPDKLFHQSWTKKRNILSFPHPWRAVLLGPPGMGKTSITKNLIVRAKPEFEEILVVHCACDSKEYLDIECQMLDEIPEPDSYDMDVKRLLILEDLDYSAMSKQQKMCLDRAFAYASTHRNTSVVLTAQDPFSVAPCVRRCANLWVLWKTHDVQALQTIGRRVGFRGPDFEHIFKKYLPNKRDSLWIDLTDGTPAPLRVNGFQVLQRVKGETPL